MFSDEGFEFVPVEGDQVRVAKSPDGGRTGFILDEPHLPDVLSAGNFPDKLPVGFGPDRRQKPAEDDDVQVLRFISLTKKDFASGEFDPLQFRNDAIERFAVHGREEGDGIQEGFQILARGFVHVELTLTEKNHATRKKSGRD